MPADLAYAELVRAAIHTFAKSWTGTARRTQVRQRLFDFLGKPAVVEGLQVSRGEFATAQREPCVAMDSERDFPRGHLGLRS
jgi:hypothetical protein